MKKIITKGIRTAMFYASAVGVFTIFADGWWKLIGVVSVLYMLAVTICTWVDEVKGES